ncbi:MFS transporter [Breoghania sp.]|uniref:MFS transporter n=1 Tax=Breoghania sp. TaxID=2065378 RepID=UPI0026288327|nr:MFS transporter [Breoghania sp.]MDJ0932063.1 MFS transporter [Breoghania sp.]
MGFGIARYGYGLFLPQARVSFDFTPVIQGAIASGSYATYLAATMLAAFLSHRRGPKIPVLLGLGCVLSGTLLVGLSRSTWIFALGIILAGGSPGLIFPALSDWSIMIGGGLRDRMFAIMNLGTGAGVILASPFALAANVDDWQQAWLMFAALILFFTVLCARFVPARTVNGRGFIGFRRDLGTAEAYKLAGARVAAALRLLAHRRARYRDLLDLCGVPGVDLHGVYRARFMSGNSAVADHRDCGLCRRHGGRRDHPSRPAHCS